MYTVIFKSSYNYCDFMCKDLNDKIDVQFIEPMSFRGRFIKGVIAHILCKLNSKMYYDMLVRTFVKPKVPRQANIIFISFDSSGRSVSKEFIEAIKAVYSDATNVLIVYNSMEGKLEKAAKYNEMYDLIFTFDPYDAKKYKWKYFEGLMPTKNTTTSVTTKEYDVVFVGNDKGRYEELKNLYITLINQKLKCIFHVTSTRQPQDSIDREILYNEPLSFDNTIELEKKSRCILDYTNVEGNQQGLSLRILEAIYCNCKILSNNKYTEILPGIKKGTYFFNTLEDLENVSQFVISENQIDTKNLQLGFEPVFEILSQFVGGRKR